MELAFILAVIVSIAVAAMWPDFSDGHLPAEYQLEEDLADGGIDELKNCSVMDTHYHG